MKAGRNDPCLCGSGKKYKKCCMEQDRAAEREGIAVVYAPGKPIQKTWADFEHLKVDDFDDDDFDEDEDDEEEEAKFIDPRQMSLFGEDEMPSLSERDLTTTDEAIQSKAADMRWDEFEAAEYEDKISIFLKTLDEIRQRIAKVLLSIYDSAVPSPNLRKNLEKVWQV